MLSRQKHFLSDVIRMGRLIRRPTQFNRKPSRRQVGSRSMSAQIDTLEQRTLLTANPIADQFLVNEAFGFEGAPPAVAVQETTGDFVVAWASFEQPPEAGVIDVTDLSGVGIYAQLFNADGTPKTQAFLVNTVTDGDQNAPAVAIDADGNFVVAWESLSTMDDDLDGHGIYAKRFEVTEAGGVTTVTPGAEFRVNTETAGDQELPAIGMDNAGNFVIAWQSFGQDDADDLTADYGIYAKRYTVADVGGVTVVTEGTEFLVNTMIQAGDQLNPTVAVARATGDFVIAYEGLAEPAVGEEEEEIGFEIWAHLYDSNGNSVGGDEFLVNVVTDKDQVNAAAAMDSDGDFTIVWQSEGQQGSGSDVFARFFDETGAAVSGEFRVNVTTAEGQRNAAVGMDDDGNVLITWQSSHQDGFSWGIYGRHFDHNGVDTPTSEFRVNGRVNGPQTNPAVGVNSGGDAVAIWLGLDATHEPAIHAHLYELPLADPVPVPTQADDVILNHYVSVEDAPPSAAMDAAGNFVVVWESYEDEGDVSGFGVFGRRFDRNGDALDVAFNVTETLINNQSNPDVASDLNGNFVVVWQADDQDGDGHGIFARVFAADGTPLTGEFQVNTTTVGDQGVPTVAMDADGDFVIAWQGPDAEGTGIFARRYEATFTTTGVTLTPGDEFQVNTETALDQFSADAAMNADGQFVIVWVSDHLAATIPELDTEKSVFAQWYDSDGTSMGPEVLVHSLDPAFEAQESPAVGIDLNGNFTVVWQSINQDGNTWGVFARQFNADKTPVQPMEFLVNETTQGPQRYPTIYMDELGNFVISWQSNHQDESSWGIFTRQYSSDATPLTGETIVNTFEAGPQVLPVMAGTPEGYYGIFWIGHGIDPLAPPAEGMGSVEGVHGRLFSQPQLFAASVAAGAPPTVIVYDGTTDQPLYVINVFDQFAGGVRVALGDITGDNVLDIIAAAGPGAGPHVRVFDGTTGEQIDGPLGSFYAYGAAFAGGVFVASADIDNDGFDDIITGADAGGGPHVRVFSGQTGADLHSFWAFDPAFAGGVRVAAGDVTADGTPDIIVGAGPGAGPHVRVFDASTTVLLNEPDNIDGAIGSYYAYEPVFRGGIYVAAGEFDGRPGMEVVTSPGMNGGPHIRVASPADFDGTNFIGNFMAYDQTYRGGVSVATIDLNNDATADIYTGQLQGSNAEARVFDGTTLPVPALLEAFNPLTDLPTPPTSGGIFVAGGLPASLGIATLDEALGSPEMGEALLNI